MPSTTPSTAISTPTSSGRRASAPRWRPSAMPMPISRRWASTMRLGQVERPERGAGEDQPGEDVPELAVALDVVVEQAVGVLVVARPSR